VNSLSVFDLARPIRTSHYRSRLGAGVERLRALLTMIDLSCNDSPSNIHSD
jgi:hypothetical protein